VLTRFGDRDQLGSVLRFFGLVWKTIRALSPVRRVGLGHAHRTTYDVLFGLVRRNLDGVVVHLAKKKGGRDKTKKSDPRSYLGVCNRSLSCEACKKKEKKSKGLR
jgi:hypothetical protein